MTTDTLIFAYVTTMLGLLVAAALSFEKRRRQFEPAASRDRVFRCEKCAFVYTDDPDVDRSRCPQCGKSNEAFEF
jgi:rubrerythrin